MDPYRERVPWPGWFLLALGLVPVGGYAALVTSDAPGWAIAALAVPLLAAAYGIWRLRHVEIEFGKEGVGFGFGGIRRRVPRDRVVGAEPKAYSVARYMGWGYRFGWEPRERAYSVLGCPRGVLLTFDDEQGRRWKVFLSSREPEKAVAAMGS
ncbi:MAG TPA: hypothetical protein VFY93_01100 [Planctomycetota bacterium]|nr:hypothetical protein [Planctomycetota bacterium]